MYHIHIHAPPNTHMCIDELYTHMSRSDEYEYEYGYVFMVGSSVPSLSRAVTSRDDVIVPIPLFSGTQMLQTSTRSDVLKTSGRELRQLFGLGT